MSTLRTCYRYEFEIQNDVRDNIANVDKSFNSNISVAEDTIDILHNIHVSRENGILKLSITVSKDELRNVKGSSEKVDHPTQTDPVTIIIGDATLLIEKIKNQKSARGGGELMKNNNSNVLSLPRQQPKGRPPSLSRSIANVKPTNIIDYNKPTSKVKLDTTFSCPICPSTFTTSPLLYDHLQQVHSEQTNQFKKPKGREGKTILYREPMPSLPAISPMMIQDHNKLVGIEPKPVIKKHSKLLLNPHIRRPNSGTIFVGTAEDRILQHGIIPASSEIVYADNSEFIDQSDMIASDKPKTKIAKIKMEPPNENIETSEII